jgi:hypothetical protein
MTSFRQIEANRRNALLSTGPKTDDGKRRTRHNAVRHGLTAETVVVALEDIRDYQAFEAAITADYDARTAVERELVLRLASLLWRIRRATAIETDLLQIQAEILHDRRNAEETPNEAEQKLYSIVYRALRMTMRPDECIPADPEDDDQNQQSNHQSDALRTSSGESDPASRELTTCFLRLANLDNGAFERLSRYEIALSRQIAQTLLLLRPANYRPTRPEHANRFLVRVSR